MLHGGAAQEKTGIKAGLLTGREKWMKKRKNIEKPSLELLRGELERTKYQQEYRKTLLNTVSVLIVVAALTVLVAMVWLPVL